MFLKNTRVLVTGGTRGIGLALAEAYGAAGARVAVCGREHSALRRVAEAHPDWAVFPADVSTHEGRRALVERALSQGPLDTLVNNAGVQRLVDFRANVDLAGLTEEIETNLVATIHLTTLLLPTLLERSRAAVVNVTSGLALVPKKSAPVYCATKAGVRAFTRALRYQLRGTNVRVIELLPPLVDTEMTRGRGTNKASPRAVAEEAMAGITTGSDEIRAGKTKLLFAVHRLSPALAARILRDS